MSNPAPWFAVLITQSSKLGYDYYGCSLVYTLALQATHPFLLLLSLHPASEF